REPQRGLGLLHRGRQSDGRVERTERLFLDGQLLGRGVVAALREDGRRALSPLGRTMERASARQRDGRESRHRLSQLLLIRLRLPTDQRSEISRGRSARGRASEATL